MADLLGFTTSEREQVGLSHKRKTPLQMEAREGLPVGSAGATWVFGATVDGRNPFRTTLKHG